MLFRPEEIHTRSPVRPIFRGPANFTISISRECVRLDRKHRLIPHLHYNRFPAIQARSVHTYRLSGKKPANRQRFKPSLSEPFLLSIYGDAILSGQTVKGRKGSNIVGTRVEPTWIGAAGVRGTGRFHQFMEQFSSLLHGET
jgi:hypothetical protein